jgi:uncharacterized protein HemX
METQEGIIQPKKSRKGKATGVLIIVILIFGALGYGYFWYRGVVERDEQATAVLSENQALSKKVTQYSELKKSISGEYNRCQEFITQKEGDFGSFEYCKKFIEWASELVAEEPSNN